MPLANLELASDFQVRRHLSNHSANQSAIIIDLLMLVCWEKLKTPAAEWFPFQYVWLDTADVRLDTADVWLDMVDVVLCKGIFSVTSIPFAFFLKNWYLSVLLVEDIHCQLIFVSWWWWWGRRKGKWRRYFVRGKEDIEIRDIYRAWCVVVVLCGIYLDVICVL